LEPEIREIIEQNLDAIKSADWLINIGPESGFGAGQIVD